MLVKFALLMTAVKYIVKIVYQLIILPLGLEQNLKCGGKNTLAFVKYFFMSMTKFECKL